MDSTLAKTALLFLAAAVCLAAFASSAEDEDDHHPYGHPVTAPVHPPVHPPIYPPRGHHHHHHHHHHHRRHHHAPNHPPLYPPVHPPLHPPAHPPTRPPGYPPLNPPVHPPAHPPTRPPGYPPLHPPVHPPAHPPVRPPGYPPVHPPTLSPVHPPVHPPTHHRPSSRKLVAVEGTVFCQSCKHSGSPNLWGDSPLSGAVVKVHCTSGKKVIELNATTNALGYFYVQTHNVSTYSYEKCKVYLVSSPLATCNKPTNLNRGVTGTRLKSHKPINLFDLYVLYTVGPFAFLPKICH